MRDAVALISGALTDPEPQLDHVLDRVLEDLGEADSNDIIAVFAGVVVSLLDELSRATNTPPAELWQGMAMRVSDRITDKGEPKWNG